MSLKQSLKEIRDFKIEVESESDFQQRLLMNKNEYAKQFMIYNPHDKQRLFHEAGNAAKERLFLAGNRTGKTYSAALEVCMHLTGNYPSWWNGYRYEEPVEAWVASDSAETTRDILQMKYYLGDEHDGKLGLIHPSLIIRKTRKSGVSDAYDTVWIRHSSGGISKLSFKAYDQKRKKFQGTQKHIIHLDEEPPQDIYSECLTRTMATSDNFHGMLIMSMTPLSGMNQLIKSFTDSRKPEEITGSKYYVMATWEDNPYLTEKEKKEMLASYSPHEIEARTKGVPSLGSGMVYPVPESMILCNPFEIPKYWPRVYAIDFGWTNETAILFGTHDRDNDILYLYSEHYLKERTPDQHAFALQHAGISWMPGVYDPAGKISRQGDGEKVVRLFQQAGFKYLSPAKNSKEEGILKTLQRMQNGKLKIFNTLKNTISELRMYARNKDGIPNDTDDHLMDAMRYLVMSGLSVARPQEQKPFHHRPPPRSNHWMAY